MPRDLAKLATFICSATIHLALISPSVGETRLDALQRNFANPPDSARPWVWGHWLHGNVDKECITRELEAMKRAGLGGVTMFDVAQPGIPAGPHSYMSESWQELFAWEIREAKRIGLEVMSQNGPGYSGNGGPWIRPELASQKIVESATRIPGGKRFSGTLPQPESIGGFYRDVAVLAIRETKAQSEFRIQDFEMKRIVWLNYIRWKGTRSAPLDATAPPEICIPLDDVIDLTKHTQKDGSLTWTAPPGEWTLLRLGHTWTGQKTLPATPESEGPECDKLDKRGIREHFDHVMKRMIELSGPEAGRTFHSFFVDSWEAGGQNWTEKMPTEFKTRRGYEITPYLPILTGRVLGDLQTTERFLYDLRQTVSELVTENFWAEMQRLCHANGMRVAAQTYITTGHDLDAANYSDEPVGEFWSHPFQPNDYRSTVKSAASAANLNGKAIVSAEAFTAAETERWRSHPATMKELGDQAFCLGSNRFQFHRFAMQRFSQLKPGMTMGKWGQHYDSTQTWWEWSKPWHDYLARCQFLLRIGPVVTDVLALAPEEPLHRFEHKPLVGYDSDACGPDSFSKLSMIDGKPGFKNGLSYQLITVNHHGTMTLNRLLKLRDLVRAGACLLGEPPIRTPGLSNLPQADAELTILSQELWGNSKQSERQVGKGKVFRGISPEEALQRLRVSQDFEGSSNLTWIHRRNADTHVYFIASAQDQASIQTCSFRVQNKSAELWNPETGETRPLATVSTADGRSSAQIPLGPDGAVFVVFHKDAARSTQTASATEPVENTEFISKEISGPWTLSFPSTSGVTAPLKLNSLSSWSLHPDPNVRHFSGTASYTCQFEIPDLNSPIRLDLGQVEIMARVKINGKDLGILWKPPYQIDVSTALVQGTNQLEVAVVNLWVNRLIGDQSLPEDSERDKNGILTRWPQWALDGKTSPSGRKSFVTFPLWKANEELLESGLLGPVTLQAPIPKR